MKFYLKQINKKFNISDKGGFTLIEIMVATSIFMIIMLVSLGALVISSDVAKTSKALRTSMDNVSFAMESMTRSLRMGTNYTCITSSVNLPDSSTNNDCSFGSGGGGAIAFTPAGGSPGVRTIGYELSSIRSDGTYGLEQCDINSCLDMTSTDINITELRFFLKGSSLSDNIQPSIYILLKGTVTTKGQPETFAIQTEVSQRSRE